MSFFSQKLTRAIKPHVCEECNGLIETGEQYRRISGTCCESGDFFWVKVCADCEALQNTIRARTGEPTMFGGMIEELDRETEETKAWLEMRDRRRARKKEWLAQKESANAQT